ncbi:MAG: tetratricopeptide repeat protein [Desulfuromonadia bacterium]
MDHNRFITYMPVVLLTLLLAACSAGRSSFNKAERLEREGKFDEAVLKYSEALSQAPDVGEYRLRFLAASEKAAQLHLKKGKSLFEAKRYEDAHREFQTALGLDPTLSLAQQLSEKSRNLQDAVMFYAEGQTLERENKPREAIRSYRRAAQLDPENGEYKSAVDRLQTVRNTRMDGYQLQLKSTKPITLKFKDAKIKEAFQILSQLSGINFIFDDGVKDQPISILLENATFQQALDILTGMKKLGKKALNEHTIVIYPRTPDKIKQYEELFVQTFYLNKLDAKKAVNLVRTMLQVKKIYVNEELNALVVRDSPDAIKVIEKILEANDVPDPEVILEVEVMELSKKNLQDFGLALSRYALQMAATTPQNQFFVDTLSTAATPTTTTTTTGTTGTTGTSATSVSNLLNLFRVNGYNGFITIPSATFNFGKTLANGETLSNPKIRVKNREKAKFNVGQRVPITTTSSNGTVGGVNVNVQYVDVGVKLNAEPVIHVNNEVNIKLSLEVSSILRIDKLGTDGNTQVATIGTRNLDTVLTLRDGETSIIGGLLQNLKNDNTQRVMFLGDIPVLGTLFSNNHKEGEKTELLLAITPRIVRGQSLPVAENSAFWTGLEDDPSVTRAYNSFRDETVAPAPPSSGSTPAPPALPTGAGAPPAVPSTPAIPRSPSPSSTVPAPTPAEKPAAVPLDIEAYDTLGGGSTFSTAPSPPAASRLATVTTEPAASAGPSPATPASPSPMPTGGQPLPRGGDQQTAPPPIPRVTVRVNAPSSVKLDEQFTVGVLAERVEKLYSAPFTLVYDPLFVDFLAAVEGNLLNKDGKQTLFRVTNDPRNGRVTVGMTRVGDVGGVSGSGPLVSALFKAKKSGQTSIGIMGPNFRAPGNQPVEVTPFNALVDVR